MELAGQCHVLYAASVVVLEALMDKGSSFIKCRVQGVKLMQA